MYHVVHAPFAKLPSTFPRIYSPIAPGLCPEAAATDPNQLTAQQMTRRGGH